ncbi:hypothetical protein [Actinopolyspora mortivallis]|uniref:Uncharacterized protein n=1 Tax=Actinopolyspora mortivallis TaxID=33906 RepID=A0A2T0GXP9_ACTMO|nr:hypothetical protein [Actinopolyspora mortivallis]PRW63881.1 hypothetical protein CEP50_07850 [Actinopolyspora mortivallis]
MLRKLVIGLGLGWIVLVLAVYSTFYLIGAFGYTKLYMEEVTPERVTEQYRWDGDERIAIGEAGLRKGMGRRALCFAVPDQGEERQLQAPSKRDRLPRYYEPWFTGKATVTCNDQVTIRSGTPLWMYDLTRSRLGMLGFAVVAALPLATVIVVTAFRSGAVKLHRR